MIEIDKNSLSKLQRKLEKQFPREAAKEGRALLRKASSELRKRVRAAAPIDSGALKRSIYTKAMSDKFGEPMAADVRVKTGKKNAAKGRDGYHWRFIEYGTQKKEARPFVKPTLEQFRGTMAEYFAEYRDLLADKFNEDR